MEHSPRSEQYTGHPSDSADREAERKTTPPPGQPAEDDAGLNEVLEYLQRLQASLKPVWSNFTGLLKAEWRYLRTLTVEGSRYCLIRAALNLTLALLLAVVWAFFIVTVWMVIATYCPVPWAAPFGIMVLHALAAGGIKIHLDRTRL